MEWRWLDSCRTELLFRLHPADPQQFSALRLRPYRRDLRLCANLNGPAAVVSATPRAPYNLDLEATIPARILELRSID